MAEIKKEELIELVNGWERINARIEKGKSVEVETFACCQEQALDLGNYIEAVYEDTDTASLIHTLEDYCEDIYRLTQIQTGEERKKIAKTTKKRIISLQNEIRFKLPPDKLEIVFLPYKASMWDSLESIYFAAAEDKDCRVTVVPIPYFDKNPDGSFGQMFDEGDQFPPNIPITSWKEYSLKEHTPDMILIHNAYDDWNLATSIHPDYYARKLKQYTDMLVYVPYFVLEEIRPEELGAVEKMTHFCFAPGIIYADRVILQSENLREIYIREFQKAARKNGMDQKQYTDRRCLEKKFLGLGSPKFDRVRATELEGPELPAKWLNCVTKSDGSRKKIILYNNSISSLLAQGEAVLEKMEEILGIWKDNQEETALWWRPHPLIPSTIKSMRPGMWERYQRMVDTYRKEGWGIYDDTADLDRAITVTDAYYGDQSSVVQLYKVTGKPVMILNVEQFFHKVKTLYFEAFARVDGHTAYAASNEVNAIFRVDTANGNCDYVGMVPNEKPDGKRLYTKALYAGENVYFVPSSADHIAVMSTKTGAIRTLPIKGVDIRSFPFYKKNSKFNGGFVYQIWVYMICCTYPGILRINTETNEIEYFDDWIGNEGYVFRKSHVMAGSICYVPSASNNLVLKFDVSANRGHLFHVGNHNNGCWSMCRAGEEFWLAPKNPGSIIRWNPETYSVSEYGQYPDSFKGNEFLFTQIYANADGLYLIPAYANMGIKISPAEETISDSGLFMVSEGTCVELMFEDDGVYYLTVSTKTEKSCVRFDRESGQKEAYWFRFAHGFDRFMEDYTKQLGLTGEVIGERHCFGLTEFLDAVGTTWMGSGAEDAAADPVPAGTRIFQVLKPW